MSSIESANLYPDPRALKRRSGWNATAQADGEKWRYEATSTKGAGVYVFAPFTNQELVGKVLYVRVSSSMQAVLDNLSIERTTRIARRDGWLAAQVADDMVGNHSLSLWHGPLVLCEVGVYAPNDWAAIYDAYTAGTIPYPWFAGPHGAAAGEKSSWTL